jgi:hypothetical protein
MILGMDGKDIRSEQEEAEELIEAIASSIRSSLAEEIPILLKDAEQVGDALVIDRSLLDKRLELLTKGELEEKDLTRHYIYAARVLNAVSSLYVKNHPIG